MHKLEEQRVSMERRPETRDIMEVVQVVSRALDNADAIARQYFLEGVAIERKSDGSPVTIADRSIEALLRKELLESYPDDSILGEEYGIAVGSSEYQWVLDPLDGTRSFVNGRTDWGILVGLMHRGIPVFGAISQPVKRERLWGDGRHACFNNNYLETIPPPVSLAESVVLTTDVSTYHQFASRERLESLVGQCKALFSLGNCYGYLMVATGKAQIMLDPIMAPWDLLPLIPIMTGAGVSITGFQGENPIGANSTVAAGRHIHGEVISILNGR